MSARKRLFSYLLKNGLKEYSSKELRIIGKADDWARSLRQLKQDGLITYEFDRTKNVYIFSQISPTYRAANKRSGLSSKDRYRIRNRDGHLCQSCGKGVKDHVKLHVDHKIPIDWGGSNLDNNLWTLCGDCNQAKKNFFKDDFDSELMKLVYAQDSGYKRLQVLFENAPNKEFSPSILQGIAGIRDWPRTLRSIRKDHGINIEWVKSNKDFPNGFYINRI